MYAPLKEKDQGKEIDFVTEKNGERIYIQVVVNANDEETAQRKFGNLKVIDDNYEKILITLRDSAPNTHKGIKMLSPTSSSCTNYCSFNMIL